MPFDAPGGRREAEEREAPSRGPRSGSPPELVLSRRASSTNVSPAWTRKARRYGRKPAASMVTSCSPAGSVPSQTPVPTLLAVDGDRGVGRVRVDLHAPRRSHEVERHLDALAPRRRRPASAARSDRLPALRRRARRASRRPSHGAGPTSVPSTKTSTFASGGALTTRCPVVTSGCSGPSTRRLVAAR